jgi:hypothetical protein
LLLAGVLTYSNSFNGVFVGDDTDAIVNNPNITSLSPLSRALDAPRDTTVAGRPVVSLSLAINYALAAPGGLDPWGYHLVNLLVHLAAGLTLFGVVRRTLLSAPLVARYPLLCGNLLRGCAAVARASPADERGDLRRTARGIADGDVPAVNALRRHSRD